VRNENKSNNTLKKRTRTKQTSNNSIMLSFRALQFVSIFLALSYEVSAFTTIQKAPHTALYASTVDTEIASGLTGASVSGMTAGLTTIFTSEQIDAILPHRYPFALVDKVVEYEKGVRAVGIKSVTKVGLVIDYSRILQILFLQNDCCNVRMKSFSMDIFLLDQSCLGFYRSKLWPN
jgi:hypothetical protein